MTTRRDFLKISGMAGAGLMMAKFAERRAYAYPTYPSPNLALWQTSLRGVGPGAMSVAGKDTFAAPITGVDHYTIDLNE